MTLNAIRDRVRNPPSALILSRRDEMLARADSLSASRGLGMPLRGSDRFPLSDWSTILTKSKGR